MHLSVHSQQRRRATRRAAFLLALASVVVAVLGRAALPVGATGFTAGTALPHLGSGRIWQVAAEPSDPSRILAATDRGIYVSSGAGATWQTSGYNSGRVWVVGFDARAPALAFAGTAGQGVISSTDGGNTWQQSSAGLLNQDVRSLAFGLEGIVAGTGSGVFLSPDGHAWHDIGLDSDSIAAVAIAANSPKLTIIAGADAGQLGSGYLYRGDAGGSWVPLLSGLPSGAVALSISAGPIDQAVPQRPLIAATTKGLFRSGDGGTTWTSSSTATPSSQNGVQAPSVNVTTVIFSPLDPGLVYAGSDAEGSTGGDLLRSTDGGVTFTPADQGLPQASKNVVTITVGQTNPPTVVAALDPPTGGGLAYVEVDTTAPAPPQLLAEAPGASIPAVISTPRPTPSPTPRPAPGVGAAPPSTGLDAFVGSVFHWPIPLIYELIFVLLVAYLFVRWRQHYYVEGPP